jgi:hypothetical protein
MESDIVAGVVNVSWVAIAGHEKGGMPKHAPLRSGDGRAGGAVPQGIRSSCGP